MIGDETAAGPPPTKRQARTRRLGLLLGALFMALGLVETALAVSRGDQIYFFWFPSLCGGGALIFWGSRIAAQRPGASLAMVAAGCLAASLATTWTVILPLLCGLLIILRATERTG